MKNFIATIVASKGASIASVTYKSEVQNLKRAFKEIGVEGLVEQIKTAKNVQIGWSYEGTTNKHLVKGGAEGGFESAPLKGCVWVSYPKVMQSLNGDKEYIRFYQCSNSTSKVVTTLVNGLPIEGELLAKVEQIIALKKASDKAKKVAKFNALTKEEQELELAKPRLFNVGTHNILSCSAYGVEVHQSVVVSAM